MRSIHHFIRIPRRCDSPSHILCVQRHIVLRPCRLTINNSRYKTKQFRSVRTLRSRIRARKTWRGNFRHENRSINRISRPKWIKIRSPFHLLESSFEQMLFSAEFNHLSVVSHMLHCLASTARELRALSTESQAYVDQAIVRTLLSLMDVEHASTAPDAAGALANLCTQDEARQLVMGAADTLPLCVKLLGRGCSSPLTTEVVRIISNLALKSSFRDQIRRANAIVPLVVLLSSDPSSGLVMQTAVALRNLSHDNLCNQDAIRDAGGISRLVKLLAVDTSVAHEAAKALKNLMMGNPTNKKELQDVGGVAPLLSLLRTDGCIQNTSAAMVLCNFVRNSGTAGQPSIGGEAFAESAELVELERLLMQNESTQDNMNVAAADTETHSQGMASPQSDDTASFQQPANELNYSLLRTSSLSACWAVLLRGTNELCDTSFRVEKFCSKCRSDGVLVHRSKIRVLPSSLSSPVSNGKGEGFWTDGASLQMKYGFRLINHTQGCDGPRLILLENSDDALMGNVLWPMLPASWVESNDQVRLWISRGTLVPRKPRKSFSQSPEMSSQSMFPKRQRLVATKSEQRQATISHPPHPSTVYNKEWVHYPSQASAAEASLPGHYGCMQYDQQQLPPFIHMRTFVPSLGSDGLSPTIGYARASDALAHRFHPHFFSHLGSFIG